jgi:hypothetical protein
VSVERGDELVHLPLALDPADGPVACEDPGTGLSGFLPAAWDHLSCQS